MGKSDKAEPETRIVQGVVQDDELQDDVLATVHGGASMVERASQAGIIIIGGVQALGGPDTFDGRSISGK
jgi:hypothetical protein